MDFLLGFLSLCCSVMFLTRSEDLTLNNCDWLDSAPRKQHVRQKRLTRGTTDLNRTHPYVVCLSFYHYYKDQDCVRWNTFMTGTLIHRRFVVTHHQAGPTSRFDASTIRIYPESCHVDDRPDPTQRRYNYGEDIFHVYGLETCLILMNDTFPEVTFFPIPISEPIATDFELKCTVIGFSPYRKDKVVYRHDDIYPVVADVRVKYLPSCYITRPYYVGYSICAVKDEKNLSFCHAGDQGAPLLCPHGSGIKPGASGGALDLYGMLNLENHRNPDGWYGCWDHRPVEQSAMFLNMYRYYYWYKYLVEDTFPAEIFPLTNVTKRTVPHTKPTSPETTTFNEFEFSTEKLGEYYDTVDYDRLRKKPTRCMNNFFLFTLFHNREGFSADVATSVLPTFATVTTIAAALALLTTIGIIVH